MKKILILLLFPLMMFAQDSTLIGDVDCSGEVNSQDASLILQFVTNVIDSLPCEANMTGLTPDQLQEMIDMMDEQLSINYSAGSGGVCDFKFPEGLSGSIVTHNLEVSGDYTVETDKRLYIVNRYSSEFVIEGINVYKSDGIPLIVNQGETISVVQYSDSIGVYSDFNSFNGILVDQTEALEVFTSSMESTGAFNVPEGKRFYLCGWYGSTPTVNGITIGLSETAPLILNSGDVLNSLSGDSHYNGYLVDEDYFADCSGGGGSTTNSLAGSGGSGIDLMFPDGFQNLETVHYNLLTQGSYQVPEGKNLYITTLTAPQPSSPFELYLLINENPVCSPQEFNTDQQHQLKIPIIVGENDIISNNTCYSEENSGCYDSDGNLYSPQSEFSIFNPGVGDYVYEGVNGTYCYYQCDYEGFTGSFYLNDYIGASEGCSNELFFEPPSNTELEPDCGLVIHGYLVDKVVDVFYYDFVSSENYVVPENQYVFIMFFQSTMESFTSELLVNGELAFSDYASGFSRNKKILPLIAGPSDTISCPIGGYVYGYILDEDYFSQSANLTGNTVDNDEQTNQNDSYLLLNDDQYDLSYSFVGDFSLTVQITDPEILNSYFYKGITCNLYDNSNSLLNSVGVFNHPSSQTNWNFGNIILDQQSGETVSVHITFLSSLGMIVIDETIVFPE